MSKYKTKYRNKSQNYLHRVLMEDLLCEKIPKGFDVHHKDFNKKNNSLDNLEIISHKKHCKLHMEKRWKDGFTRNGVTKGLFTLDGVTLSIREWSKKINISQQTLANRIYCSGWSLRDCLTRPLDNRGGRK